jgi:hypothetical protein
MTKAEWRDEGKLLGERASASGWEIGTWLIRGEEAFLGTAPTNKKERRVYFARRRENWIAFMHEASTITNLADTTLRQYARVARHGVRVDGLPFAHHIEVQRCRPIDEKGKPRFSANAALEILNLAKENNWPVSKTRAEVVRRFPTPKVVETVLDKMRRVLSEILKTVEAGEQLMFLDALADELPLIREQVEKERTEAILRILNDDDNFDDPSGMPPY